MSGSLNDFELPDDRPVAHAMPESVTDRPTAADAKLDIAAIVRRHWPTWDAVMVSRDRRLGVGK